MSIKIGVTHYNYDNREEFLHDLNIFHNYWVPNQEALDGWRTLFSTFGDTEIKEIKNCSYESFDEIIFFRGEQAVIDLYNQTQASMVARRFRKL